MTSETQYDAIIVGSGAGGGQTAYTLTMEGAKVLMIEAGRHFDPATTPMFQINGHAPLRGAPTPDKQAGFYDGTAGGGWTIPGEPYVNDSAEPERQFMWWRSRMLGGRTNHWGRIALRFGPYDFKPYSRDGLGVDWPISYEEIAPYYDKVEMLIGVFGAAEGLENSPDSPAGVLLAPPKARAGEMLIAQRGRKLGLTVAPIHRAVLSARQDADVLPARLHPQNPRAQRILAESMRQRAACFWATDCHRGCSIKANYQSTTVHLPPALATGNLEIATDAMVREVTLDPAGKATGVVYIDKKSGLERRARGRAVVLAAGSQETVRILLNSKSPSFPNGLANSSGHLGRYIMDTPQSSFHGQVPILENLPLHNEDGAGIHSYIPWGFYREQRSGKLDFPRGYHMQFTTGRQLPSIATGSGIEWLTQGSYGRQFKEDQRRYYGSFVGFGSVGEMIPNDDCFCEIDPAVKDKWGIPVLRFHWKWSEHEARQAAHAQRISAELISALGGRTKLTPQTDGRKVLTRGGEIIHEVGGARMGSDRRKSVTDAWGRTWDVKNLFLADGATFASNADKNPTLTILALAWRTADHILEQMKKGGNLMERREAIKWMLSATAAVAFLDRAALGESTTSASRPARGYGNDPDMLKNYAPGDFWPLTLTAAQRATAAALCDLIIPADAKSPSAADLGVPDFIDEWVSAPYPGHDRDRAMIVGGLEWIEAEARRRFGSDFSALVWGQKSQICDDICHAPKAQPQFKEAAAFFQRYRNLTAGGFYTTAEGMKDIGYVGNVPLSSFEGPPPEALAKLGLL